jgi:hypothetical protein
MDDGGKNSIDFQYHCALRNFIKVTKSECEKGEKIALAQQYVNFASRSRTSKQYNARPSGQ